MLHKMVCAVFVMTVAVGLVSAEVFMAQVTKVDGHKVTLQKYKKGEAKKFEKDGDEVTLPVAKGAKIMKGKFDQEAKKFVPGDAIEGGLKSDAFKAGAKGGPFVRVTTSEDNKSITEILIFSFGKNKGKKDAKDK